VTPPRHTSTAEPRQPWPMNRRKAGPAAALPRVAEAYQVA
jgi:hypothetical protein